MSKKMQHCFNCGKELGIYDHCPGDIETCGSSECEREARNCERERSDQLREDAASDNYERYSY